MLQNKILNVVARQCAKIMRLHADDCECYACFVHHCLVTPRDTFETLFLTVDSNGHCRKKFVPAQWVDDVKHTFEVSTATVAKNWFQMCIFMTSVG